MFSESILVQKMVVYCFRNQVTGKVYIGKTVKDMRTRLSAHLWFAFKGKSNMYFHRALRKYGVGSFELSILATATDNDALCELEKTFIQKMDANKAATGYNLTGGGEGSLGYVPSEATLEKRRATVRKPREPLSIQTRIRLSIANAGPRHPLHGVVFSDDKIDEFRLLLGDAPHVPKPKRPHKRPVWSEESRAKIREANINRIISKETGLRISVANRGKVRSEESRARYRESKLGTNNPQFGKPGTMRDTKWMHKESGERKMVLVSEVHDHLCSGWLLGMKPKKVRV